jgi:murein DD-endopeptidase MepM/ murein hydrolase activator NlpD
MYNISNFLFIACLFLSTSAYSQKPESPQNTKTGFVSPLDIPLLLSSNYGEYRSGHFHAGVDFKTQQVEGKKVFAADSGYVYRIAVLLWG